MVGRLEGKIAIVTGGGSGFGAGIATKFVQEGAKVLICDLSEQNGTKVAQSLGCEFLVADVTKRSDWEALLKKAIDDLGGLDIVVNNAGTTYSNKPTEAVTDAEFDLCFNVNVKSIYLSSSVLLPYFMEQNRPGCFIQIASTAGIRPRPGLTWYNASKAAVSNATKTMAVEYAPKKIRFNAVCPVVGSTGLRRDSGQQLPGLKDCLGQEISAQRPLLPQPRPAVPEFFVPGVSVLYLDGLPIRTYLIGGIIYNMQQPPNETKSTVSRFTIDRRCIRYSLEVVQQPEKARACGSGPRSSNDRRPVDPPPVVELKVFTNDVDTTMQYDATFMLYASLEVARPIAGGKMHIPPAIPVLAGVTIASAAYLEKPKRAAYFIFPDLSVRHEGWYRLRFSLFEGVKHDMDADHGKPFVRTQSDGDNLTAPVRHEGVFNRMEVLSTPFQVYSAKKFPGLNQSTALSMMVADQGCRVRIRRDVRQRKRRQKSGADGDDARSSYQGTPQATYRNLDHSRSASRNSMVSQLEEPPRRISLDNLHDLQDAALLRRHEAAMAASNSIAPNPMLPLPTTSMPPPSAYSQSPLRRPSFDTRPKPTFAMPTPRPAQPAAPLPNPPSLQRPMTPDTEKSLTLPPLRLFGASGPKLDPLVPRYSMPAPAATKRSFSPGSYSQNASLKDGARPGVPPAHCPPPPPPSGNDIIEPDVGGNDDDDEEAELFADALIYTRADGTKSYRYRPGASYFR